MLSAADYEREVQEQKALNSAKGITNSRVREKLNASIQKGRISSMGQQEKPRVQRPRATSNGEEMDGMNEEMEADMENLGGVDEMDDGYTVNKGAAGWVETTNSESKLPQLPQTEKRAFDVDPKKNLKEVLKK